MKVVDQIQNQVGMEEIVQAAEADDFYVRILKNDSLQLQFGVYQKDRLLFTRDSQLYVPNNRIVRFKLVLEHHDQPFSGHWSLDKTLTALRRNYYWPTMKLDTKEVIETCEVCQRSQIQKKSDQAPIRFLEAQYPWEIVTVDFVSGFAPTKRKHTAICVICDRFTRMMHAEPCNDHATAKEAAKIMLRRLFALHGCPRVIVSDRGSQFDSEL